MFNDLRGFIQLAEQAGECKVVLGADWDLEIGIITHLAVEMPNPPLLIFDNIKGYQTGYRVASGLFSTPKRTALGLGLPIELKGTELVKALRDRIEKGIGHIPPVEVETAPVKENVIMGDALICSNSRLLGGMNLTAGDISALGLWV